MSAYNVRSLSLVRSAGNVYPVDSTPPEPPLLPASSFDDLVAAAFFEAYVL